MNIHTITPYIKFILVSYKRKIFSPPRVNYFLYFLIIIGMDIAEIAKRIRNQGEKSRNPVFVLEVGIPSAMKWSDSGDLTVRSAYLKLTLIKCSPFTVLRSTKPTPQSFDTIL